MHLYNVVYGKMAQVGDRLVTADGRTLLIGDINTTGGVCDDCAPDANTEIVSINGQAIPPEVVCTCGCRPDGHAKEGKGGCYRCQYSDKPCKRFVKKER